MLSIRRFLACPGVLACLLALGIPAVSTAATPETQLAFPGAQGWAAHTPGGRGGQILRVTTLAADGPGSFRAAVETSGPRIVVFEVGGVIDLGVRTLALGAQGGPRCGGQRVAARRSRVATRSSRAVSRAWLNGRPGGLVASTRVTPRSKTPS